MFNELLEELKNKKPWEMSREEYNSITLPEKKPTKVFYIKVGNSDVEVIQNPTSSDIRQMSKEVRDKYPTMGKGEIALRSTQDKYDNKYYWKADEAIHKYIEEPLSKLVGEELNQNAGITPYNRMLYNALQAGETLPDNIYTEFKKLYPNVDIENN